MKSDLFWMNKALSLAKRAWGKTSPNPMVGAVIVKKDLCVGSGYHHQAGTPHAEVHALRVAGKKAKGATLYVTLEPCSTTGRTPPCTEAIIQSGIKKVVIACLDPNPLHAGRAVAILQQHHIQVEVGVAESAAQQLNESFFHWITTGRPFLLLKMGTSLDGKIATPQGVSKWITGEKARLHVQKLRQWSDAILVGSHTVQLDHPSLNVRIPQKWKNQPQRLIATQRFTDQEIQQLMPGSPTPHCIRARSKKEWLKELQRLGSQNITAILVEGGGSLAGHLLKMQLINKIEFHYAPKIIGGENSKSVVAGPDPVDLKTVTSLQKLKIFRLGNDFVVSGYPVISE